jgi:hypothetical protein
MANQVTTDPVNQAIIDQLNGSGQTQPQGGMPSGIDPALAAVYQNAGQTPQGRGTGFADWQYWQGVGPSQYGRLGADIAGTGTDQSTGTPWASGAWQGSGQGTPPAPSAGTSPSPLNTSSQADQILSQIEGNVNDQVRQLMNGGSGQTGTGI